MVAVAMVVAAVAVTMVVAAAAMAILLVLGGRPREGVRSYNSSWSSKPSPLLSIRLKISIAREKFFLRKSVNNRVTRTSIVSGGGAAGVDVILELESRLTPLRALALERRLGGGWSARDGGWASLNEARDAGTDAGAAFKGAFA